MLTTLELHNYSSRDQARVSNVTTALGRWVGELFGCQHKEMSRPFSRQGETFRVCIACGARRKFDEGKWTSTGGYYYKPARMSDMQGIDTAAIRCI